MDFLVVRQKRWNQKMLLWLRIGQSNFLTVSPKYHAIKKWKLDVYLMPTCGFFNNYGTNCKWQHNILIIRSKMSTFYLQVVHLGRTRLMASNRVNCAKLALTKVGRTKKPASSVRRVRLRSRQEVKIRVTVSVSINRQNNGLPNDTSTSPKYRTTS